jgi:hypothetical protein
MARITLLYLSILLLSLAQPAQAQKWVNISYPWSFVEHNAAAEMIDDTRDYFVFGTARGILYFMERDRASGLLKTMRQREVWAPVKELRAADVTGDHNPELIATTRRGDLFVINLGNLEDIWRTPEGYFSSISAFTVANVDGDSKMEILLIADDRLVIMTGDEETEEYRSTEEYLATQIIVADVDNDSQDEIVLNTGQVLDAQFRQLEWAFRTKFGDKIDVFDIDGDGNLEIVGTSAAGDIRIIEADERRVKFE